MIEEAGVALVAIAPTDPEVAWSPVLESSTVGTVRIGASVLRRNILVRAFTANPVTSEEHVAAAWNACSRRHFRRPTYN